MASERLGLSARLLVIISFQRDWKSMMSMYGETEEERKDQKYQSGLRVNGGIGVDQ